MDADALDNLWNPALADARIDPSAARLFAFPGGSSVGGDMAMTWLPGHEIGGPDSERDFGSLTGAANDSETRHLRRVALWLGNRVQEEVAALMRHELEHSLQFDEDPALFDPLPRRAIQEL